MVWDLGFPVILDSSGESVEFSLHVEDGPRLTETPAYSRHLQFAEGRQVEFLKVAGTAPPTPLSWKGPVLSLRGLVCSVRAPGVCVVTVTEPSSSHEHFLRAAFCA